MAKVFVYIEASIAADGKEAKAALTPALKKKLQAVAIKEIKAGVPKKGYSTKASDKPKTKDVYNALKVEAVCKLSLETKGTNLKVGLIVKMVFEAIKWPKVKGSMIGSGNSTGHVENAGSGVKLIEGSAGDLFYAIATPLTKKALSGSSLKKMAGNLGLKIE